MHFSRVMLVEWLHANLDWLVLLASWNNFCFVLYSCFIVTVVPIFIHSKPHSFSVPDVNKSTWQSLVVESELPVLVEFWASWCGPCKMIDPIVGKLSKEYEGKLKCYKLNTDDNPDIATQLGIRSIPTMMIFKNGEKKDAVIGAVPESTLITCIDKYVADRWILNLSQLALDSDK